MDQKSDRNWTECNQTISCGCLILRLVVASCSQTQQISKNCSCLSSYSIYKVQYVSYMYTHKKAWLLLLKLLLILLYNEMGQSPVKHIHLLRVYIPCSCAWTFWSCAAKKKQCSTTLPDGSHEVFIVPLWFLPSSAQAQLNSGSFQI